jgi:hypothetical protein
VSVEDLCEAVFSVRSVQRLYLENRKKPVSIEKSVTGESLERFCRQRDQSESEAVVRRPPPVESVEAMDAEEPSLF